MAQDQDNRRGRTYCQTSPRFRGPRTAGPKIFSSGGKRQIPVAGNHHRKRKSPVAETTTTAIVRKPPLLSISRGGSASRRGRTPSRQQMQSASGASLIRLPRGLDPGEGSPMIDDNQAAGAIRASLVRVPLLRCSGAAERK